MIVLTAISTSLLFNRDDNLMTSMLSRPNSKMEEVSWIVSSEIRASVLISERINAASFVQEKGIEGGAAVLGVRTPFVVVFLVTFTVDNAIESSELSIFWPSSEIVNTNEASILSKRVLASFELIAEPCATIKRLRSPLGLRDASKASGYYTDISNTIRSVYLF